jgi:hypothetical protein
MQRLLDRLVDRFESDPAVAAFRVTVDGVPVRLTLGGVIVVRVADPQEWPDMDALGERGYLAFTELVDGIPRVTVAPGALDLGSSDPAELATTALVTEAARAQQLWAWDRARHQRRRFPLRGRDRDAELEQARIIVPELAVGAYAYWPALPGEVAAAQVVAGVLLAGALVSAVASRADVARVFEQARSHAVAPRAAGREWVFVVGFNDDDAVSLVQSPAITRTYSRNAFDRYVAKRLALIVSRDGVSMFLDREVGQADELPSAGSGSGGSMSGGAAPSTPPSGDGRAATSGPPDPLSAFRPLSGSASGGDLMLGAGGLGGGGRGGDGWYWPHRPHRHRPATRRDPALVPTGKDAADLTFFGTHATEFDADPALVGGSDASGSVVVPRGLKRSREDGGDGEGRRVRFREMPAVSEGPSTPHAGVGHPGVQGEPWRWVVDERVPRLGWSVDGEVWRHDLAGVVVRLVGGVWRVEIAQRDAGAAPRPAQWGGGVLSIGADGSWVLTAEGGEQVLGVVEVEPAARLLLGGPQAVPDPGPGALELMRRVVEAELRILDLPLSAVAGSVFGQQLLHEAAQLWRQLADVSAEVAAGDVMRTALGQLAQFTALRGQLTGQVVAMPIGEGRVVVVPLKGWRQVADDVYEHHDAGLRATGDGHSGAVWLSNLGKGKGRAEPGSLDFPFPAVAQTHQSAGLAWLRHAPYAPAMTPIAPDPRTNPEGWLVLRLRELFPRRLISGADGAVRRYADVVRSARSHAQQEVAVQAAAAQVRNRPALPGGHNPPSLGGFDQRPPSAAPADFAVLERRAMRTLIREEESWLVRLGLNIVHWEPDGWYARLSLDGAGARVADRSQERQLAQTDSHAAIWETSSVQPNPDGTDVTVVVRRDAFRSTAYLRRTVRDMMVFRRQRRENPEASYPGNEGRLAELNSHASDLDAELAAFMAAGSNLPPMILFPIFTRAGIPWEGREPLSSSRVAEMITAIGRRSAPGARVYLEIESWDSVAPDPPAVERLARDLAFGARRKVHYRILQESGAPGQPTQIDGTI